MLIGSIVANVTAAMATAINVSTVQQFLKQIEGMGNKLFKDRK
jgi:hypothetical protein